MKVLTLNLRNCTDDSGGPNSWDSRLPYVAERINECAPDIVAFQEVRGMNDDPCATEMPEEDNCSGNMAQQLRALCPGYTSLLTVPADCYPGAGVWEGLGLMARVALYAWGYKQLELAPGVDDNRRVMLWAEYSVDGRSLFVSNNHFAMSEPQTLANAGEIVQTLRDLSNDKGHGDHPPLRDLGLLVGDLNVQPGSCTTQILGYGGWTDLWKGRGEGDGYTFNLEKGLFERIDYQWANQAFLGAAKGLATEVVFTEPKQVEDGETYVSDHAGVLTTFEL